MEEVTVYLTRDFQNGDFGSGCILKIGSCNFVLIE
jgi:hypothetical protein